MKKKNFNLEETIIINAASDYFSYDNREEILEAYDKLDELGENGKGHEVASNHVLIWEPFEHNDIDNIMNLIHDNIDRKRKDIPNFIYKMDWDALKGQKEVLLGIIEYNRLGSIINNNLEGIVSLIDGIQDYAVDELGLPENKVFNLKE